MRLFKSLILWIALFLFMGRILGQVYVGIYSNEGVLSVFPPWEHWYSGALPYPYLLFSQLLIFQLLTLMAYDYTRSQGLFFLESSLIKKTIRSLSTFYFLAMFVRALWFNEHHYIPIIFHCILAVFLFVYAFPAHTKELRKFKTL